MAWGWGSEEGQQFLHSRSGTIQTTDIYIYICEFQPVHVGFNANALKAEIRPVAAARDSDAEPSEQSRR